MSIKYPDIDIDTRTDFDPKTVFPTIARASRVQDGELLKHPCGYYFQNIPVDGHTHLAAIPYKNAEDLEYFKVDFLHLNVYDFFENRDEIEVLVKEEPDWSLLEHKEHVEKLFQLANHYDVIRKVKPQSIEEVADVLALIRPGKRKLILDYINGNLTTTELYDTTDDAYSFKRAHALAYAHVIVLQLHLIKAQVI